MKIIKKILLVAAVFFITCIFTTIIKETNISYLVVIPPLVGFYIIYRIFKK